MTEPENKGFIRCNRPVCEPCDKEEQRQVAQAQALQKTDPIAYLAIPAKDLKMLRETLCAISTYLPQAQINPSWGQRVLNDLFREIDRHRPLGPDGMHGNLHTPTCGCEDK